MTPAERLAELEREAALLRAQIAEDTAAAYVMQHEPSAPPLTVTAADVLAYAEPSRAAVLARGVQRITQAELDARRARDQSWLLAGGGRMPDEYQPPPPPVRPPAEPSRFVRESIEDGYTPWP